MRAQLGTKCGDYKKRRICSNCSNAEKMRRYFVDGRIVLTPVAEGYYVAEGRFIPLVALSDSTLDSVVARGCNHTCPTGFTVPIEVQVA